jgi:hypothetical protein
MEERVPDATNVMLKFRYSGDYFPNLPRVFSRSMSFYLDGMRMEVRREIHTVLRRLFASNVNYSLEATIKLTKGLSDIMKRAGKDMSPNWRFLVDMHQTVGYTQIDVKTYDLVGETRDWLSHELNHNDYFIADEARVRKYIEDLMTNNDLGDLRTRREFLLNVPEYATMGSGRTLPKLKVKAKYWDKAASEWVHDDNFVCPSTKWCGFLASTVEEIESHMDKDGPFEIWVFIKPDETGGKERSIAVTDVPNYLRMAYLNQFINRLFANCPYIPLFWNDEKRKVQWKLNTDMTHERYPLFCEPIDQTAFDANTSLKLIRLVTKILCDIIQENMLENYPYANDVRDTCEKLIKSISLKGVVHAGDVLLEWLNGLPSGLIWTSLLGSICNYVEFREICDAMNVPFDELDVKCFQGDDIQVRSTNVEYLVAIYEGYLQYGLKVNPLKFWIKKGTDEFLRMVMEDGELRAYPARMVNGILYRKPGSPAIVQEDWFDLLDSWKKYVSRGADPEKVVNMVVSEAMRIFRIDRVEATELLYTPRAYGGGGWEYNPLKIQTYRSIDIDVTNRAKFLPGTIVPLFSSLLIPKEMHHELLNNYLGDILPTKRYRVVEYKSTFSREDMRLFQTQLPYSISPFQLQSIAMPRPRWIVENSIMRDYILLQYTQKQINISLFSSYFYNTYQITNNARKLGRRAFIKWITGGLVSTPLTLTNPWLIADLPDFVGARFWSQLKRLGLNRFKALVEVILQGWIRSYELRDGVKYAY